MHSGSGPQSVIDTNSASRNLALQVASPMLHPHPSLPTAPPLHEPLGRTLLISPTTLSQDSRLMDGGLASKRVFARVLFKAGQHSIDQIRRRRDRQGWHRTPAWRGA
ncbi:hypothetical protein BGW80DRAFT_1367120 [Lactifluus volemus]|nr:hypothetical protein BGW80DRAFT_1367120 [Lactifluus volemus]